MRAFATTVFLFLFADLVSVGAQVKKSDVSSRYRVPKVSRSKARIICPIFKENQYPYQGIGVKMGDPMAITYKLYPTRHWAFAADVGRSSSGLYSDYYRGSFKNYTPSDTASYLAHKVTRDWFIETKILYQWNAEKISKGLMLYTGVGWQWRNTALHYDYKYPATSPLAYGSTNVSRATFGPVVVLGFEYAYFTWPVSAFIEVELFTDEKVDPGYHRFQGGVGLRYVF
ncbi:MAG: hypothetical protein JST48_15230 [Bacteroidetes bacterium]|nr:hypothetical protein [Bacteroidota bacterium]